MARDAAAPLEAPAVAAEPAQRPTALDEWGLTPIDAELGDSDRAMRWLERVGAPA